MSNVAQVRTIRAFYEDSAKSKVTIKYAGVVGVPATPPVMKANNDGRTIGLLTPSRQVVDSGTNTIISYTTDVRISPLDKLLVSNVGGVVKFRDQPVANLVTADIFSSGSWNSDSWDYYIKVGADGTGTDIGYEAGAYGAMEFDQGKKDPTQIKQFTFVTDENEFIVEPKGGKRIFGSTCRLSMQGMPKASVPIDLSWDEANQNYSMLSPQFSFYVDEFALIDGARIGFSLSARN